ncbi:MAG: hypothetical protein ACPGWR_06740 [Ardenticatenaceae bacterium]
MTQNEQPEWAPQAPIAMSDEPQKLWDPKHAAIGFVVIVLFVFFLDILPRLIRAKLDKSTDLNQQVIPDIEELLTPNE